MSKRTADQSQEANMTFQMHAVAVKQLPEALHAKRGRIFFEEMESWINVDRPRIVLDCSNICHMDSSVVHVMLCCLEEAMKRNGDVKLASLNETAKAQLNLMGLDRLFEIFASNADAVNSFRRLAVDVTPHFLKSESSQLPSRNAA
jgi:anti-sigma B factor antagonist